LVAIKPPNAQGVYSGGTRLEVSRHLEGDVPDILAGELIRKMRDSFVAGRFDQALTTGTQTILATLAQRLAVSMEGIDPGEALLQPVPHPFSQPVPPPTPGKAETSSYESIILLVFLSMVGLIIYAIYSDWSSLRNSKDYKKARKLATGGGTDWGSGSSSEGWGGGSWGGGSWGGGGWGGGGGGSDGGGFGGGGGGGDFGGGGASDSW
jgi:uncharacterized protein